MESLELETASHESMALSTEKPANRLTTEQQAGNVSLLEKLPKYLMLISPFLPAYSLKLNYWCKHQDSALRCGVLTSR